MKIKLLHIDDNPESRLFVQKSLNPELWQVSSCGSVQAMARARAELWQVILLEVALTDVDGLSLLKQLQYDPRTQAIPVILLTSRVMHHELEHYYQFKIAGVIAKPFDLLTLAQDIRCKLRQSSLQRFSA